MAGQRHLLLIGIEDYPNIEGATLQGSSNDVIELGKLLIRSFDFPSENVSFLLNEGATQKAIREAFDATWEKIEPDDVVVVYYSGHGSRIRDPERDGQWRESIVPCDSGRGERPNLDVTDLEIDAWVRHLNEKTPHVTLIFDCCHSGSVTRDAFGAAPREAPPDSRPPETMFEGGLVPAVLRQPATRPLDAEPDGAFVDRGRQAVVITACRATELANEYWIDEGGNRFAHGAFTYFLARALRGARSGMTWRDVFEQVAPEVSAVYRDQHPQVEGRWDGVLFDTDRVRPRSYLRLSEVAGDRVTIAGGAAHGVTRGSIWSIHPHGARHTESEEIARVRIETVAPAASEGPAVEASGELRAGQRAFLREQQVAASRLAVRIDAVGPSADALRRRVAASTLLDEAGETHADVLARQAPSPSGGQPWTALGADGRLAVHIRPEGEEDRLVDDLENLVRFRGLLAVENSDPASSLAGRVRLLVKRWDPRTESFVDPEPAPGDGVPVFDEGQRLDIEVVSHHDADLWTSLVQFGCDGEISLMVPYHGHPTYRPDGFRLEPGRPLRLSEYYGIPGFEPQLPTEGFPWTSESGAVSHTGQMYLKLMVTSEPADFEFLAQGGFRDLAPQAHPLKDLARLFASGEGSRNLTLGCADATDWTTVKRTLVLRRSSG